VETGEFRKLWRGEYGEGKEKSGEKIGVKKISVRLGTSTEGGAREIKQGKE